MQQYINLDKEIIPFFSENENHFIPIKPFCEVLGISHETQYKQIKSHLIYGSTMVQKTTVAADEREREMLCLPLKYFLFWITGINANLVKEEVKDNVLLVQGKIFDAVYDRFFLEPQRQKEKLLVIREKELEIFNLECQRKELNSTIKARKDELETFKEADVNQLKLSV